MANSPRPHERGGYPNPHPPSPSPNPNPSFLPSPTSHSSTSSSSSSNNTNNGVLRHHYHHSLSSPTTPKHYHHHQQQQQQPQNPPVTRSESNPYPTTFVQADTTSFKQVVQMLTGASDKPGPAQPKPANPIPPIKTTSGPNKSKLYERRNSLKNSLRISPLIPSATTTHGGYSPRNLNAGDNQILSPSILDFPALVLSPVTPLIPDPFNRSPPTTINKAAEEKAIAEKGFFLHPSPGSTPRDSEPRLLPLFPVTSPRFSGSDHHHHPSS